MMLITGGGRNNPGVNGAGARQQSWLENCKNIWGCLDKNCVLCSFLAKKKIKNKTGKKQFQPRQNICLFWRGCGVFAVQLLRKMLSNKIPFPEETSRCCDHGIHSGGRNPEPKGRNQLWLPRFPGLREFGVFQQKAAGPSWADGVTSRPRVSQAPDGPQEPLWPQTSRKGLSKRSSKEKGVKIPVFHQRVDNP